MKASALTAKEKLRVAVAFVWGAIYATAAIGFIVLIVASFALYLIGGFTAEELLSFSQRMFWPAILPVLMVSIPISYRAYKKTLMSLEDRARNNISPE